MTTHKTPLGNSYTDEEMADLKAMMPNMVARGEGREFFETMMDAVILADKISKGEPASSPAEAEQMTVVRKGVAMFDKAVLGQTTH